METIRHDLNIIVAHPNKQHSYRLAVALNKAGCLSCYITTVYEKKHNLTGLLNRYAPSKYRSKISNKRCSELDDYRVKQFDEIGGLLFLIMIRIPVVKRFYRRFGTYLNKNFGKKVAKYAIKTKADAVVMYDTTADACFTYLKDKAPNIIRILDMSSNVSTERVKIYEREMKRTCSLELRNENRHLWNDNFLRRNLREVENTCYFFAPSEFSKNSILAQNIKENKVFLNQYGVDIQKFCFSKHRRTGNILKLAYTGGVTYGKGIDFLLETLNSFKLFSTEIYLMGQVDFGSSIYQKYKDNKDIHFMGFISQSEIIELYSKVDIFVFPSLGEGLSLAALEAMACGLPVICSSNSGINDLIDNYKNGIVFEACNEQELVDALVWMRTHGNFLEQMSLNARNTAEKYTWEAYEERTKHIINTIFSRGDDQ